MGSETRQKEKLSCDASPTEASGDLMGNSQALKLGRPMLG